MAGKGTEAMKKRMAYVRSFRKTKKVGKMSPKREVKAASPRRMTRKSRATKKEGKVSRKSPVRKSRKSAMKVKTYA